MDIVAGFVRCCFSPCASVLPAADRIPAPTPTPTPTPTLTPTLTPKTIIAARRRSPPPTLMSPPQSLAPPSPAPASSATPSPPSGASTSRFPSPTPPPPSSFMSRTTSSAPRSSVPSPFPPRESLQARRSRGGGRPPKPDTALRVSLQLTPVELTNDYRHGIAGDPEKSGVRNAYFPVRRGCSATLYQDAHIRDGKVPEIRLEDGTTFEHEKCWEDICHAILEAHHLIYLVGWSIYHEVKLVREPTRPLPNAGRLTLGDLLKYKSQEGVSLGRQDFTPKFLFQDGRSYANS